MQLNPEQLIKFITFHKFKGIIAELGQDFSWLKVLFPYVKFYVCNKFVQER